MYLPDPLMCTRRGCIEPRSTKKLCQHHQNILNKKSRDRRRKRKENGLCAKCDIHRLCNHSLCLYHYFSNLAKRYLNDKSKGSLLYKKYLDQDKTCYFTNLPIEPGNLSIDHLLPQSQYVHLKFEITNLVFCHLIVNHMKRDYPIEQFLNYCTLISNNHKNIQEGFNAIQSKI